MAQRRNYNKLMGRKCVFVNWNGKNIKAIVGGCDWDLGLTVQSLKKEYLICTNGPASPLNKELGKTKLTRAVKVHRDFMDYVWTHLRDKKPLKHAELVVIRNKVYGDAMRYGSPTASNCAFSQ